MMSRYENLCYWNFVHLNLVRGFVGRRASPGRGRGSSHCSGFARLRLKGEFIIEFQDWGIKTNANQEFIKLRAADGGCSVLCSKTTGGHLCACLGTHGKEQRYRGQK